MANKISGIYAIINTKNGKVYIGQTQDFHKRWRAHVGLLNSAHHHNLHLQASWNKYGAKVFKFLKLERCPIEKLNEREEHYIAIYTRIGKCYNIAQCATAPMRGLTHSETTRLKMSEANMGNKFGVGRKISEETRNKLSSAKKNMSEETKKKMSEAARNRPPISEETRRRKSEAAKRQHARLRGEIE